MTDSKKPDIIRVGQRWAYSGREFTIVAQGSIYTSDKSAWTFKYLSGATTWDYQNALIKDKEYTFLTEAEAEGLMDKPQKITPGQVWKVNGREMIVQREGTLSDKTRSSCVTYCFTDKPDAISCERIDYILASSVYSYEKDSAKVDALRIGQRFLYKGKEVVLLRKGIGSDWDIHDIWKWAYTDKLEDTHIDLTANITGSQYTFLGEGNPVRPSNVRVGQVYKFGSDTRTIVKKGSTRENIGVADTDEVDAWTFDNKTWTTEENLVSGKYIFVSEPASPKPKNIYPGQVWRHAGSEFTVKRIIGDMARFSDENDWEKTEQLLNNAEWECVESKPLSVKSGQKWTFAGTNLTIKRRGDITDAGRKDAWVYTLEGNTQEHWDQKSTFINDPLFQLVEDVQIMKPSRVLTGQKWSFQEKEFIITHIDGDNCTLVCAKDGTEIQETVPNLMKSDDYSLLKEAVGKVSPRLGHHWSYRGKEFVLIALEGRNFQYRYLEDDRETYCDENDLSSMTEYQFVSAVEQDKKVAIGQHWIYDGQEIVIIRTGSVSDPKTEQSWTWKYLKSGKTNWVYENSFAGSSFAFLFDGAKPAVAVAQKWSYEGKDLVITKLDAEDVYYKSTPSSAEEKILLEVFATDKMTYIGMGNILPKPSEIKPGQVWKRTNSESEWTVTRSGRPDGSIKENVWTVNGTNTINASEVLSDPTWVMISERPKTAAIGQVWRIKTGKEYTIRNELGLQNKAWEFQDGSFVYEADLQDKEAWTFVKNSLPKPKVVIGQLWKYNGKEFIVRRAGSVTDKSAINSYVMSFKSGSYPDIWIDEEGFKLESFEFIANSVDKPTAVKAGQVWSLDGRALVVKMMGASDGDKSVTVTFDDGTWEYEQRLLTNESYIFITENNRGAEEATKEQAAMDPAKARRNRAAIAQNVVDLLQSGDQVYGSFVRDMVSGDDFESIDVFLKSNTSDNYFNEAEEEARKQFVTRLQRTFGIVNVKIGARREVGDSKDTLYKQEVQVVYNGVTVRLDLTTQSSNNPFDQLDADVNGLAMGRDRTITSRSGLDTERVKTHIKSRTFAILAAGAALAGARTLLDKLTSKGYTDTSRLRIGTMVSVPDSKSLLKHLSTEEQLGWFEIIGQKDNEYLLKMPDSLTADGEAKGHTMHSFGDVPGWWVPKSEVVSMAERKILEVKVKETDVGNLPKELQAPSKERTFKYIREDKDRYLLEMPKGVGHQADTSKDFGAKDSWWVPKDACEVTKQEGGEEVKKMEEKKAEKTGEVASAAGTFKEQFLSEAGEAAYIAAGTQITKGIRMAILKVIETQLRDRYQAEGLKGAKQNKAVESGLQGIKFFLDSDFGQAAISTALGYGLQYAPGVKDDARAKKLAGHLRVQGMAGGMNAVAGVAVEHLFPVIMGAINGLPALPEMKLEDLAVSLPEVETVSAGSSAGASARA